MPFNGTGSNVTSLNASNISSGTLAVARGGTGTSTPSLVGGTNITISGTWPNQTVTASGGGVTSLNGQTGAITNTTYQAIGSYAFSGTLFTNVGTMSTGTTVSGANLRVYSGATWNSGGYYEGGSPTSASGTWRYMGSELVAQASGAGWLFVRVS